MEENRFTIALSAHGGEWGMVLEFNRPYGRKEAVKIISAAAADLLRRYLERKPMFGDYFSEENQRDVFTKQCGEISTVGRHKRSRVCSPGLLSFYC